METTDMKAETAIPHTVETAKMASRNVRATVVSLTRKTLR